MKNNALLKIIGIFLITGLMFFLYACGGGGSSTSETTTTTVADVTTTTSAGTTTTTTTGTTTSSTTTSTTTTTLHTNMNWMYITEPINHSGLALGADGTIYVGTSRQNVERAYLYALESTGTLLWRYQLGVSEEVDGGCAIDDNGDLYFITELYITEHDCTYYLYSVSSSGTLNWKYEMESSVQQNYTPEVCPAIGADGTIYAPAKNGLYAVDTDGDLLWSYDPDPGVDFITPAIGSSGAIYLSSGYGMHAVNTDGSEKWFYEYDEPGTYFSPAAIGSGETIYFGAGGSGVEGDEYFYALNSAGTLEWRATSEGLAISASPAIGEDGTIYVGTTAKGTAQQDGQCGIFFAYNPNGTKKWSYDTSEDHVALFPTARSDIYAAPLVGSDGTIYFHSEGNFLYAMNSDGTVAASYNMFELSPRSSGSSSLIRNSMAIADDGTIYCADYYHYYDADAGTQEGAVYALDIGAAGLASSPWPKYMHDNQNNGRVD